MFAGSVYLTLSTVSMVMESKNDEVAYAYNPHHGTLLSMKNKGSYSMWHAVKLHQFMNGRVLLHSIEKQEAKCIHMGFHYIP